MTKKPFMPWNKNLTKETDERVKKMAINKSIIQRGKKPIYLTFKNLKHTELTKEKMRVAKLGKIMGEQGKENLRKLYKGKTYEQIHGIETAIKLKKLCSIRNKGKNNPMFNNWSSREKYGEDFTSELCNKIRIRDQFRCQECFRHQNELSKKLDIHHIDFNKKNNNPNNLISLCRNCHMQTNFKRNGWENYFNNIQNERLLGL